MIAGYSVGIELGTGMTRSPLALSCRVSISKHGERRPNWKQGVGIWLLRGVAVRWMDQR